MMMMSMMFSLILDETAANRILMTLINQLLIELLEFLGHLMNPRSVVVVLVAVFEDFLDIGVEMLGGGVVLAFEFLFYCP